MQNRIFQLRKAKGYSQEKLAQLAGVTRQTINAIENAKYSPSLELAFTLANLLNVKVDELFMKDGD
ncbi:MAG: helix-turn-helix transcriptional regulator [Firmicutes bacterium]|uniref:Helix-turn-helix transcriptional regulator n=1 Tax=Candidatus Gallilactobacillus intestinavium TaxID=2840838 RepID=A0A9D9E4W7_9LACO|nr:helix-turn-helix transcriptional regulator [Candidatus Gallilactobacillus intestinavium]